CDDVEIGCGGTLAALATARPDVHITVAVFAGNAVRTPETRAAIGRLLARSAHVDVDVHDFRDGFFPTEWARIKECFEALKKRCRPDLVLTHFGHDAHQDHRTVSELTWNTFRDHLVLE